MAPASSGASSVSRRTAKRPTATTKAFRFEPFSVRLSRTKIDPVHTVDRAHLEGVEDCLSKSYFRSALEEWSELNLTATFSSFFNKANPLSESLPQIVYHADTIIKLLNQHIETHDVLALEPLLLLVTQLARDLGATFEEYFLDTVATVTHAASVVDDATAIESSFNCLVWMFKYLSKIVLTDLRPLLKIMLPYLSHKKEYLRRFSAEALSFLLRRAAIVYDRRSAPLKNALEYLFNQITDHPKDAGVTGYMQSLMVLLSECALGVDARVHSCAPSLLRCSMDLVTLQDAESASRAAEVVQGLLVNLIHHTNAQGFAVMDSAIVQGAAEQSNRPTPLAFFRKLLLVLVATRQGSRVTSWDKIVGLLPALAQATPSAQNIQARNDFVAIVASVISFAPFDQLLTLLHGNMELIVSLLTTTEFLLLSNTVSDMSHDRFASIMLQPLQAIMNKSWNTNEHELIYLLTELARKPSSVLPESSNTNLVISAQWKTSILQRIERAPLDLEAGSSVPALLQLARAVRHSDNMSQAPGFQDALFKCAIGAHSKLSADLNANTRLGMGWAFKTWAENCEPDSVSFQQALDAGLGTSRGVPTLVPFMQAIEILLNKTSVPRLSNAKVDSFITTTIDNVLSQDKKLRRSSLAILLKLAKLLSDAWLSETCTLLQELEATQYSPATVREIGMLVRRLPQQLKRLSPHSSLYRLVPFFALGLLHRYHDQTCQELCESIYLMASTSVQAEEIIVGMLATWLESSELNETGHALISMDKQSMSVPNFSCSYLQQMRDGVARRMEQYSKANQILTERFESAHQLQPQRTPKQGRSTALQVFALMPQIAEKRSRVIVPIFLSIRHDMPDVNKAPSSDHSTSSHTLTPDFDPHTWHYHDRKMFLDIFSKFANPAVLYRAAEVRKALLDLLQNGNAEIRSRSLKALLTWSDPSLRKHMDALQHIAQDKSITTELAVLISKGDESGSIQPEDRESVQPVLLRLVFGQLVGRTGTDGSLEARRKAILRVVLRMQSEDILKFFGIAMGSLSEISIERDSVAPNGALSWNMLSWDQQHGFLRLVAAAAEIMESQISTYADTLFTAVLYCTARACRQVYAASQDASTLIPTQLRTLRRTGLQCLTLLFEHCGQFDCDRYGPFIYTEIIGPRLTNFANETSQGISAILRLEGVWMQSSHLVPLLTDFDSRLMTETWAVLKVKSVREDVKLFVLTHILMPLVEHRLDDDLSSSTSRVQVLKTHIDQILQALAEVLENQPSKDVLLLCTQVMTRLSSFHLAPSSIGSILDLLITLLGDSTRHLPPHIKGSILQAINGLVRQTEYDVSDTTGGKLFHLISSLYNYFKDHPNRVILGDILTHTVGSSGELQAAVRLCQDLDSYSSTTLNEIDYDRRASAYTTIRNMSVNNEMVWSLIVNSLLFHARSSEEFSIRSNAVSCLKSFVNSISQGTSCDLKHIFRDILIPALKKGSRADSELIRADFVMLLGLVVKHAGSLHDLEDMEVLLVGDDEEASFFTNILHIQQHRRLRAVRRLTSEVQRGLITPSHIADYFLPLLDKFINDESVDESSQSIKGQSILACTILLQWIDWRTFRRILRQYKQDLNTGLRPQKDSIKLLNNAADALVIAFAGCSSTDTSPESKTTLCTSLPDKQILFRELKDNFIPVLSTFVRHKDETELSLRLPVAKITVKLINLLEPDDIPSLIAPILLDLAQVLRSRSQESRDMVRNALADIVNLVGPSSILFTVKELRTALTRGYQLHVLGHTLHTILLQSESSRQPGDLDYCIEDLMAVIMDDIFGVVGQEKDSQDYVSSMREIKGHKSPDSIEILARSTSVRYLSRLLKPFSSLLSGSLLPKQSRQVDELLRRIGIGISHNPAAGSLDLLIFAHELIRSSSDPMTERGHVPMTTDERNRSRYLVQLESQRRSSAPGSTSLLYKLVRFAFDIVRSALVRHPTLMKPENVHGFVPLIDDTLVRGQDETRISAMRLLSAIIKTPLPEFETNALVYVMEAVKIIRGCNGTNEESAQAALKLVTAILREKQGVVVRDTDVAYLLQRIRPDLEEPDRQGVTFNYIKAVMFRQFQLPEIYDLVDQIATIMVTSHSRDSRNAARGIYVHFLLDYPQSGNRWTKQVKFLMKNLDYQHPEGRQSVMEAIFNLLQKLSGNVVSDLVSSLVIPITLRMSNDEDNACREMAGALLTQFYRRVDPSQSALLLQPLREWLQQDKNQALLKLGLQAWISFVDAGTEQTEKEMPIVLAAISRVLQATDDDTETHGLQYQALALFDKLTETHPAVVTTQRHKGIWLRIPSFLRHQHDWLCICAANLLSRFFETCPPLQSQSSAAVLVGAHGLRFDSEILLTIIRNSLGSMRRNEGNQELSKPTLHNLLYLGMYALRSQLKIEVRTALPETKGEPETLSDSDDGARETQGQKLTTVSISASKYMLDQCTRILRAEPSKFTTAAFLPRLSALALLGKLIPHLDLLEPTSASLTGLMVPLQHITDQHAQPPRSIDPTFIETYTSYTDAANEVLAQIQDKVGDDAYISLLTQVSATVRQRRDERRQERAINRVADPERAARDKKRKSERKKERKKEIADVHRKRRRKDLGF